MMRRGRAPGVVAADLVSADSGVARGAAGRGAPHAEAAWSRGGYAVAAALLVTGLLGSPAGADEPLLTPVDHDAWQKALASHRGSIVVVDFWASWCVPCIERFPEMVKLADEYADRGVVFLAFDLDDPEDAAALEHAESFAREQGGRIGHYRTTEPVVPAFQQLGLLGIPAVYVYGRDGELAHRLTGDDPRAQFTEADVERAVRELLDG